MVNLILIVSLSIAFLSGFEVYGQSEPSASKLNEQIPAENLVRMHEAWGPKMSTPGTSLVIKESTRSGEIIIFRLIADGVPKGSVYSLMTWPVTQKGPSEALTGVTVDGSGLAVCAGMPGTCGSADKPNDPIDVNLRPVPGEPIRLALVSADGATKVFAKVVPIPLRGENRGCSVEATLLTPGAELVLIVGSGLPPNINLTLDSSSEGEHFSGKGKTDADGRYISAIEPYTRGVARGVAKVNLKTAGCVPSVSVPWGRRN